MLKVQSQVKNLYGARIVIADTGRVAHNMPDYVYDYEGCQQDNNCDNLRIITIAICNFFNATACKCEDDCEFIVSYSRVTYDKGLYFIDVVVRSKPDYNNDERPHELIYNFYKVIKQLAGTNKVAYQYLKRY